MYLRVFNETLKHMGECENGNGNGNVYHTMMLRDFTAVRQSSAAHLR